MAKPKRPRRQRKGDRLISPDARRDEIMVDHAVAAFDREATRLERKWGYDRLPELVAPDLAARFGGAIGYLNEAIREANPDKAAAAAQNCIRGLHAMEAAAIKAGHQPPQAIAHGDLDGWAFRIVADAADTAAIEHDGISTFTLREVAIALRAQLGSPLVEAVKERFPRAEVCAVKKMPPVDWESGGDEISF